MNRIDKSVSIVIPCLNEEESIGQCILAAKKSLGKCLKKDTKREIIVADNNSHDHSVSIAKKNGAKVVRQNIRGYGAACVKGINSSKCEFIILADGDGSYDFYETPKLLKQLVLGADLVLGSRIQGNIDKDSMPFFHRYFGTPLLTLLINFFYNCRITDSQTGFRGFTRTAIRKMDLKGSGMEFASEMILKAISNNLKISEIPVSYHKRKGVSKLSPFLDAMRHLSAILIYSPTYVLIIPGFFAFLIGITGTFWLLTGPKPIGRVIIDIHTMIASVLISFIGIHIVLIGFFTRFYLARKWGIKGGFLSQFLLKHFKVKRLFLAGAAFAFIPLCIILQITFSWITSGFSSLAKEREFIVFSGMLIIGIQVMISSIFFGILEREL